MMKIKDALIKNLPEQDGTWDLVVGMPEDGQESEFRRNGCDLINTLACNTHEVDCVLFRRNILGRIITTQEFKANVCFEVLDAFHNGVDYVRSNDGNWHVNEGTK